MAVKRKYQNDRRITKEAAKGDDFRDKRVKKAKYEQRKQRVSKVESCFKTLR